MAFALRHLGLALCLAAAVTIRLALFSGFQGHDDRNYLYYALMFARTGEPDRAYLTPWAGRIGAWLPLAAALTVGDGFTLSWYSLCCSVVNVIIAYALGWHLARRRAVAVAAALLVACYPLDVIFGTAPYVDVPHGLWCTASLLLLWLSFARRKTCLAVGAGLSAGIAWLHKETAVLLIPAAFVLWWKMGRQVRLGLAACAAGMAVVAAEGAFWASYGESPLHRFETILTESVADRDPGGKAPAIVRAWILGRGVRPVPRIVEPFVMVVTHHEFAVHFLVGLVGLVWGCRHQCGLTSSLAVSALALVLTVAYLPVFPPWPLLCMPRYYTVVTPIACAFAAAWMYRMGVRWRWALVAGCVAVAMLCLGVDGSRYKLASEKGLLQMVRRYPSVAFYAHPQTVWRVAVINGLALPPNLGVHSLTSSRHANSYVTATNAWPSLPKLDDTDDQALEHAVVCVAGKRKLRRILKKDPTLRVVADIDRPLPLIGRALREGWVHPWLRDAVMERLRASAGGSLFLLRRTPQAEPAHSQSAAAGDPAGG